MLWFKHATCSHNDPDISDSWDTFGDAAPTIFWTILEIYGKEFNHLDQNGFLKLTIKFFEREMRRKMKKSIKILEFFKERGRILFKIDQIYIYINVPKFILISSNWTKRESVSHTEAPTEAPTAKEEKRREEKRKEEKRREEKKPKKLFSESIYLTEDEEKKLREKYNSQFDQALEILNNYKMSKGKKYKSDYHVLMGWVAKEIKAIPKPKKRDYTYQELRDLESIENTKQLNEEMRIEKEAKKNAERTI